jgi:dTDP-4-dehydrorhamnose reductase
LTSPEKFNRHAPDFKKDASCGGGSFPGIPVKILVLGGDGMLGHQLLRQLGDRHEIYVTLRRDPESYQSLGLFDRERTYYGMDARSSEKLLEIVAACRPEAVINAIGIVKQRAEATDAIQSLEINALLPHRLAMICRVAGARFVHVSTDCVFSGRRGRYLETDVSDAEDLYGRTKYLGETSGKHCVTLRTSIIGRELSRKAGLLEWFLAQRGPVKGYTNAVFSGFTTLEMARIIEKALTVRVPLSGLYHVSSEPISKFELLTMIRDAFRLPTKIEPDDGFQCDRSLDSSRFRETLGYRPPSWKTMVEELAQDTQGAGG